MKIKLLKDVIEAGHLKFTRRRNKKYTGPDCAEPEFITIPFIAGMIIEASEETAKKYIERGLAVTVEPT